MKIGDRVKLCTGETGIIDEIFCRTVRVKFIDYSIITQEDKLLLEKKENISISDAYNRIREELQSNPEYFNLWAEKIRYIGLSSYSKAIEKLFNIQQPKVIKKTLEDYHEKK